MSTVSEANNNAEILAIIPARGGSKGIPNKNIIPLAGKPLLHHTIEQAQNTAMIQRIVVSTDSEQIANLASDHGAQIVHRPSAISGDTATSESALIHTLDYLRDSEGYTPDLIVFLQCTSPLRRPDDIGHAIQLLIDEDADSLLSVVPSHRFLWREGTNGAESVNYDYRARPRRQDMSPEYAENGSIYIFKPEILRSDNNRLGGRVALYVMNPWSSVDIDHPEDLRLAEWIMQNNLHLT